MANKKIDDLATRQFRKVFSIKKFSLSRGYLYSGYLVMDVDVVLTGDLEGDGLDLEIRFLNVADFKFRNSNGLFGCSRITVSDIASRGWEGLRYQVADDEEQWFSFYCKDFEVREGELALESEAGLGDLQLR